MAFVFDVLGGLLVFAGAVMALTGSLGLTGLFIVSVGVMALGFGIVARASKRKR